MQNSSIFHSVDCYNNYKDTNSYDCDHFFFTINNYPTTKFTVLKLKGEESLCSDYQFNITVLCDTAIDDKQLLGLKAQLSWESNTSISQRHGIISQIISDGMDNEKYVYTFILHSPLYPLRLSCHIQTYRNKDITAIISDVLLANEWLNYEFRFVLSKPSPNIEFIMHFNQSDFEFIHNLLTRYGFTYYFEQQPDYAIWVISDNEINVPSEQNCVLNFQTQTSLNTKSFSVFHVQNEVLLLNNHFALNAYNYLNPDSDLNVKTQNLTGTPGVGVISLSDQYYLDYASGNLIAATLQQQLDCQRIMFTAKSNYRDLLPGQIITLCNHPHSNWNSRYKIVSLSLEIEQDGVIPFDSVHNNSGYNYNLKLIPISCDSLSFKYQPQTSFALPLFHGVMLGKIIADNFAQSAAVDEYGRYVVLLPFDVNLKLITIPLRMLQTYGGNHPDYDSYGWHFPLSIGTVVLLSFINGNINRPIILGVMPNKFMPSPVNVNNHTQNSITTMSSHQILFEEQKGLQKILFQTPLQCNSLVLDATQNKHQIQLTSQHGQLQLYAQKNISIVTQDSMNSHSKENHQINISNQQKLNSQQQSIQLRSGNNIKFNAQNNINLSTQNGVMSVYSQHNFIAQINGSCTLNSYSGNWHTQLQNGNIYCMSNKDITMQCKATGDIELKQGCSTISINNNGTVLMRANKIYLNAPMISLKKNVILNGSPVIF